MHRRLQATGYLIEEGTRIIVDDCRKPRLSIPELLNRMEVEDIKDVKRCIRPEGEFALELSFTFGLPKEYSNPQLIVYSNSTDKLKRIANIKVDYKSGEIKTVNIKNPSVEGSFYNPDVLNLSGEIIKERITRFTAKRI